MKPDRRPRDVHGLDADGRVACNPRDREAALRADVRDIRTGPAAAVTCTRCLRALARGGRRRGESR